MPRMQISDVKTSVIARRTKSEVLPVFLTGSGSVHDCTVSSDGRVRAVGDGRADPRELAGEFVTQGMVDLQVNGFAGIDFNQPGLNADRIDRTLSQMARTGVTTLLPTIITGPAERMIAALRDLDRAVSASELGPLMVAGYHIEGPFLSPENGYSGAHSPTDMSAAGIEFVDELQRVASRPIAIMTVAPEITGVLELIPQLAARRIHTSIGHSAASLSQIEAAITAGAALSTHLGNGVPHMQHRTDNTVFWQLAQDGLTAMFIADGIHVPRHALQTMLRAKGVDRAILTTDAVSAAGPGMPPGAYTLGQAMIELSADGTVRIPGSRYLAGAAVTMDRMLRNLMAWYGMPIPEILKLTHLNPARVIGGTDGDSPNGKPAKFIEWHMAADGPEVQRTHIGPLTIE